MKDIPHVRRVVAVMLAALSMAAHGSDGSQGSGAGTKEEAHASGQVQVGSGASPASPIEIVDSRGDETPGVGLERKYRESGYARVVRVDPSDLRMSESHAVWALFIVAALLHGLSRFDWRDAGRLTLWDLERSRIYIQIE